METGIKIGGDINKDAVVELRNAIVLVLKTAYATRCDQETVRTALKGLTDSLSVTTATISNCHLEG